MDAIIYYFTGTGNSLAIARGLAERIDGEVALRHIAAERAAERVVPPCKTVGLVYPVYAFSPPRMVSEFAAKLDLPEDAYIFAVADAASFAGAAIAMLEGELRGRGHRLDAGYILKMPGNFTPLAGADSSAKQGKYFERIVGGMGRVAGDVNARRSGVGNRGVPPLTWLGFLFRLMLGQMLKRAPRKFSAEEGCTGCGRCARICPTANIEMKDGRPVWGSDCELCMACLQWCPVEAVQLGWMTRGRGRYHHPDIAAQELIDALERGGA